MMPDDLRLFATAWRRHERFREAILLLVALAALLFWPLLKLAHLVI